MYIHDLCTLIILCFRALKPQVVYIVNAPGKCVEIVYIEASYVGLFVKALPKSALVSTQILTQHY